MRRMKKLVFRIWEEGENGLEWPLSPSFVLFGVKALVIRKHPKYPKLRKLYLHSNINVGNASTVRMIPAPLHADSLFCVETEQTVISR